MTTLRVLLGEHWPEPAAARWALIDNSGKVLGAGEGEPRNWPPTERIEAVLNGPQANWVKVRVPRASSREQEHALGFAREEQLVREADSQHLTPSLKGEEAWSVLVIARERLKRLQAQFEAISRPLDGAFVITQTLPTETDAWVLAPCEDFLIVRTQAHEGWVEDLGDQGPILLVNALHAARETGSLPARLIFRGERDTPDLPAWEESLGLSLETGKPWNWFELPQSANNLLHGEFLPRHRRQAWRKALRPALLGLGLILGLQLVLGTGYAWWRRAELSRVKTGMSRILQSQLPNDPIQDPVLQLQRELNRQRESHGQLADDALLALLADFSIALGGDAKEVLRSLKYRERTLEIEFMPGRIEADRLKARLETKGLVLIAREGEGEYTLRRKP